MSMASNALGPDLRGGPVVRAAPPAAPPTSLADLRFRALLPPGAWDTLPVATRRRFGRRLGPGEAIVYRGRTERTRMTVWGRTLATLARLVGAPLPLPGVAEGGAAVVTVTEAAGGAGQFWTRQYARRSGFPQIVHSAKRFAGPTGIEEQVGGGIGMALRIGAEDGVLTFRSAGYFVRIGERRVPLPTRLLPQLIVGHEDLGGEGPGGEGPGGEGPDNEGPGAFAFTLRLTHPVLGTLIDQRCAFTETARAAEGDTA